MGRRELIFINMLNKGKAVIIAEYCKYTPYGQKYVDTQTSPTLWTFLKQLSAETCSSVIVPLCTK